MYAVMIICASRRTDIPAFHAEWMMNRLKDGHVLVRNPVCRNVVYDVNLTPESVDCIVFITKDPRPMIPYLDELDSMGIAYTFQITITPYCKNIEPAVPFVADITDAFRIISKHIGPIRTTWRYDPIIFNRYMNLAYHRKWFNLISRELEGTTDRCIFSFLDTYSHMNNLFRSATDSEIEETATYIARTAKNYGMEPCCCCPDRNLTYTGVSVRGCIDGIQMEKLGVPWKKQTSPVREWCRCIRNIDIGAYGTCNHRCLYCYAQRSDLVINCDPTSEMLGGRLMPDDHIKKIADCHLPRITDYL